MEPLTHGNFPRVAADLSVVNRARARWFAVGAVVVAATACGEDEGSRGVVVSDAWSRPTPAGTTTNAVYMRLQADNDDALVAVSVDPSVASMAMAHETATDDEMMSMDHAMAIELPADDEVAFEPGGLHVMLEGLAAPLVDGDTFSLTLDFVQADDEVVEVDVREVAP